MARRSHRPPARGRQAKGEAAETTGTTEIAALEALATLLEARPAR